MEESTTSEDQGQNNSHLKRLEDMLRCPICYEFFDTAVMITLCSHNYCSLCVRKYFSYKNQCPTCSVNAAEVDLVKNKVLDDLVSLFTKKRMLKNLGDIFVEKNIKGNFNSNKPIATKKGMEATSKKRHVKSSSPGNHSQKSEELKSAITSPSSSLSPESSTANKVPCPVCSVPLRENMMNRHLDECLMRDERSSTLRSNTPKRKPLPKLVYNLMSDKELRRRLKTHGLSALGDRQILVRRHQEFTVLYNAECDSADPKTAEELAKDVEKNERTKSVLAKTTVSAKLKFSKNATADEINKGKKEYEKKHKSHFKQLIEQTRLRKSCKVDKNSNNQTTDNKGSVTKQYVQENQTDIVIIDDLEDTITQNSKILVNSSNITSENVLSVNYQPQSPDDNSTTGASTLLTKEEKQNSFINLGQDSFGNVVANAYVDNMQERQPDESLRQKLNTEVATFVGNVKTPISSNEVETSPVFTKVKQRRSSIVESDVDMFADESDGSSEASCSILTTNSKTESPEEINKTTKKRKLSLCTRTVKKSRRERELS